MSDVCFCAKVGTFWKPFLMCQFCKNGPKNQEIDLEENVALGMDGYRIAGKFGGGFNLAIWRCRKKSPN